MSEKYKLNVPEIHIFSLQQRKWTSKKYKGDYRHSSISCHKTNSQNKNIYWKIKCVCVLIQLHLNRNTYACRGRHGCDRMVVWFTTTYTISVYHQLRCEFEYRSGGVYLIQHCMIKFVSDLRQVVGILRILRFPPSIKLTATIRLKHCWKWR